MNDIKAMKKARKLLKRSADILLKINHPKGGIVGGIGADLKRDIILAKINAKGTPTVDGSGTRG